MKNVKIIILTTLLGFCISGCDNKLEGVQKTINDLYNELSNSYRVSGSINEIYNKKVTTSTFNTFITNDSYHYDVVNGNKEKGEVNYFKTEDNYVGEYLLNKDNEVTLNKATTSDGDYMGWAYVSNPFLDSTSDSSFFSKKDDKTYFLDFSKDNDTNNNRYQSARNFVSKLAILNISVFDTFTLTLSNSNLTSIYIKSKEVSTTNNATIYYEVNMTIDSDKTLNNEAYKLEPLKHEAYHDDLLNAFNYMFNNGFSVKRVALVNGTKFKNIDGYFNNNLIYYVDPNNKSDFTSLILKDDGVHTIIYENDTYYYEEEVLSYDDNEIKSLSSYLPTREVPVEGFIYNKESNKYVLKTNNLVNADKFTYYFDPIMDLDEASYSIIYDEVELTLDENKRISEIKSICNNDQFVTYLISYNKDLLPFDETKLEPFNSAKSLFGDYKGTLIFQKTKEDDVGIYDNLEINISISLVKDKYSESYAIDVTIGNEIYGPYRATDINFYDNTFYFYISDDSFILKKNSDGSYSLEFTTGSYKTYSARLTKIK